MIIKVPLINYNFDTDIVLVSILGTSIAIILQIWFDSTKFAAKSTIKNFFLLGSLVFPIGYSLYYLFPDFIYYILILMTALASFSLYNILLQIL